LQYYWKRQCQRDSGVFRRVAASTFFTLFCNLLFRVQTSFAAKLIHIFSWQFLNVARVNHPNRTLD
ncbi:hypothetical protein S245_005882, partial [Arachis hypogaea]